MSAIQIKYRKDPNYFLTATHDRLDSMVSEALKPPRVITYEKKGKYRHFIFTSAKGMSYNTDDNKYEGYIKCYGINEIKTIVDNNKNFWRNFRNLLK